MANKVIIMRGVPGSGKSESAHWIASHGNRMTTPTWKKDCVTYYGSRTHDFASSSSKRTMFVEELGGHYQINSAIHSTDEYFMANGKYKFNPSKIGKNHNKNYKAFRDSVDVGIPLVIVDNTNTTHREWSKYEAYANDNNYWVSYYVMPHPDLNVAVERNTHGVPMDVIKKMIERFE